MSKVLHIGTSPITGRIYAGHLLKDGITWASNQHDVTGAACGAVAEHAMNAGKSITVNLNGKPKYRITVEDMAVQPTVATPDVQLTDLQLTLTAENQKRQEVAQQRDQLVAMLEEVLDKVPLTDSGSCYTPTATKARALIAAVKGGAA